MAAVYLSPKEGEKVPLQTEAQKRMIAAGMQCAPERNHTSGGAQETLDWLHPQRSGNEDLTYPRCVPLRFTSDRYPVTVTLTAENGETRSFLTDTGSVEADDLYAGMAYTWQVEGADMAAHFETEPDFPRFLHADGLSNIRDTGGFPTKDGRTTRQGCIYRGSEMDTHQTATPEGIRTMRDVLHIKTDLDLRGEAVGRISSSPLGDDIGFALIPTCAYADFMSEGHRETCHRLFAVLADKSQYPVYYHCWGGADRTGTLTFFLHALLGVPDSLLFLDYELTSLSIWGDRSRNSELFTGFLAELEKYEGDTYGERAVSFLRSCGIGESTLASVRENLLI